MKKIVFGVIVILILCINSTSRAEKGVEEVNYKLDGYELSLSIDHDAACEINGFETYQGFKTSFVIQNSQQFAMYNGCAFIVKSATGERYAVISWLDPATYEKVGSIFKLKTKKKK